MKTYNTGRNNWTRRLVGWILMTVLIVSLFGAFPKPAYAYGTDDYPYKNKPYQDWSIHDEWNYYYRECTSFVAFRLNKTNGIAFHNMYKGVNFGNAGTWINAAKSVGITVNTTPALGAVACWTSGNTGHVAWVCAVSGSNVTVEEYNWGTAGTYGKRTIAKTNPTGYIHFKDLPVECTHSWKIQKIQTAPTATAKGSWLFKCSKCNTTKTVAIPALENAALRNGQYMISSRLDPNKYVSVTPYQSRQEGNISLYSKGVADQTFVLERKSNGCYVFNYGSNNLVLDVAGAEGSFGGTVWLWEKNNSSTQDWYIIPAGNGYYRITTRSSYYNMDVANAGTANGTNIGTHYNNGNNAQLFKLEFVPCTTHKWNAGVVTKEPTYTAAGVKTYTCKVCGETKTETIAKLVNKDISKATMSRLVARAYTGSAIKPGVTLTMNGTTLKKGTDYSVSYKNNVNIGTATITFTGKGEYTGKLVKKFKIIPKGTSITSLSGGTAQFSVKWAKQTVQITGYQVQYSLYKDYRTYKTVGAAASATSKVIKNLEPDRTYYVRVRTYKYVGDVKYNSVWSEIKNVDT